MRNRIKLFVVLLLVGSPAWAQPVNGRVRPQDTRIVGPRAGGLDLGNANLAPLQLAQPQGRWLGAMDVEKEAFVRMLEGVPDEGAGHANYLRTASILHGAFTRPAEGEALAWQIYDRKKADTWAKLARPLHSEALRLSAERTASFYAEAAKVRVDPTALDRSELQKVVQLGEDLFGERVEELLRERERGLAEIEMSATSPEAAERARVYMAMNYVREVNVVDMLALLADVQSADEADYARRGLISSAFFTTMAASGDLVVSIQRVDSVDGGASSVRHVGTGFWYRGRVITCAHVVYAAANDLAADNLELSKLRVVTAGPDGTFAGGEGLELSVQPLGSGGSKVFWEWDTACLAIVPTAAFDESHVEELADRFGIGASSTVVYDSSGSQLERTIVHGVAVVDETGTPALSWVQPGRILFPPNVLAPAGNQVSLAGQGFRMALRNEVVGRLPEAATAGNLQDLVTNAFDALLDPEAEHPSYKPPAQGSRRTLHYPVAPGSDWLAEAPPGFTQDARIPCFGADLVTLGGASGAPIFRLTSDRPEVVGIHTGREVPDTSRYLFPSLENMERAVPFYLVRKLIDSFLDS